MLLADGRLLGYVVCDALVCGACAQLYHGSCGAGERGGEPCRLVDALDD